ncbi:MAG TPA: acylphosphatase, partial [Bryobacteraceae bacterium]
MKSLVRRRIRVTGIVQGVGFRPFVYAAAVRRKLTGFVENDSQGVAIEIEGDEAQIADFLNELRENPPPLASIDGIESLEIPPLGSDAFAIHVSHSLAGESTPVPPDIAVCEDCLVELFDPQNRRYRYPFLNCTNCGPRFTIIQDLPYDRPATTMASFRMCAACEREYHDPLDRRFHAQP